ncbi:hypothetical protein [Falsiroseomonas stagni]|uniref:Uncharacterized protein n=1 Tax=Falsiroseomonas stagni DSM 19981 TaxID=1123062 RepID=A0A1I3Z8W1_9PROT|nr:hypothetical protein [Falsiroseomonas stagni]SFK40578.1 hypothetical protein SAMN02745775_102304 [Falsiroseomonas stagni DSM 19981]
MPRGRILACLLLLAACTTPGTSQPVTGAEAPRAAAAPAGDTVASLAASPEHRRRLEAAARRSAIGYGCTNAQPGQAEAALPWRPPVAPYMLNDRPVRHSWIQAIAVQGCPGFDRVVTITSVADNGTAATDTYIIGGSQVDPWLARDVLSQAVRPMARTRFPGCDRVAVAGTRVTRQPTANRAAGWAEAWTLSGCGQRRDIMLTFKPTPTGTDFTASDPRTTTL